MIRRSPILLAALWCVGCCVCGAADDSPSDPSTPPSAEGVLPPEVGELDLRFRQLLKERVTGSFAAGLEKLDTAYLGGIARAITTEQTAGRLDGVLALEAERKRAEEKQALPEKDEEEALPSLVELRKIYRAEYAKLESIRAASLNALVDPLDARLAQIEAEFTKAGRLDDAKTTRDYRLELAGEMETLGYLVGDPTGPGATGDFEGKKAGELREIGGIPMAWCPPGSFTMGSPTDEPQRQYDEDQVKVRFGSGFWLARTEVTQRQWERVRKDNPSYHKGADLPVERVSWTEAQDFIEQWSQRVPLPEGWRWSLPTEAQWEYACRAGTETAYSCGETLDESQAKIKGGKAAEAVEVAGYEANAWGLHDMHGNVREWCLDWHGASLPGGEDPAAPGTGTIRVRRGGSWNHDPSSCRSACRHKGPPEDRNSDLGFRLAIVRENP